MATREPLRKVTVALPQELIEFADTRARELGTSRSQVIGMALAAAKLDEVEQLAAEGYRFYSDEAAEFAAAAEQAVAAAWTSADGATTDEEAWNGGQAR